MPIFANSAGWKTNGPDLDPEVGAVDLLRRSPAGAAPAAAAADRDDRVAVALEHVVVAQDRIVTANRTRPSTNQLAWSRARWSRSGRSSPARSGQQRDQREQVGVGVGKRDPQVDVGGQADREEDRRRRSARGCQRLERWVKTAAKPAVSSRRRGIRASSSRLRALTSTPASARGLRRRDVGVCARAQVVAGDSAPRRSADQRGGHGPRRRRSS